MIVALYLIVAAGLFSIAWDVCNGRASIRGAGSAIGVAVAWPALLAVAVAFGLVDLVIWVRRMIARRAV